MRTCLVLTLGVIGLAIDGIEKVAARVFERVRPPVIPLSLRDDIARAEVEAVVRATQEEVFEQLRGVVS